MADPGSPPLIELAAADDIAPILAIANEAALHTAANFATEPEPLADWVLAWEGTRVQYPWLVARVSARSPILGFAKASPYRARGAYRWTAEVTVYVDPASHGKGVGSALYRVLIPTLRRQGFLTLLAGITLPNAASERLHEAHGFVRCATFHQAGFKLGRWHDVGFAELLLRELRPGDNDAPADLLPVSSVWPPPAVLPGEGGA